MYCFLMIARLEFVLSGTQLSTHVVLFGEGCYNLVETWSIQSYGPLREAEFRQCLHLPPECGRDHLPHSKRFEFDTSRDTWHTSLSNRLKQLGFESKQFQVKPGQLIVLPTYCGNATRFHFSI
jgi:hypothetical protein